MPPQKRLFDTECAVEMTMELTSDHGSGVYPSFFPIPDRVCCQCAQDVQEVFFLLSYTSLNLHRTTHRYTFSNVKS